MLRQLRLSEWPVGLEQDAAVLQLQPDELSRRAGISFERNHDGLDDFDGAVVELDNGKFLAFQHYLNSPGEGTKLIVWSGGNFGVREAVNLLNLKRGEIIWIAPQLEDEFTQALNVRQKMREPGGWIALAAAMTITIAGHAVRNLLRGIRISP